MRGREDAFAVFITQGETSVPASVLLQDLHHIPKLQSKEGVGGLLRLIAIDHCRERER